LKKFLKKNKKVLIVIFAVAVILIVLSVSVVPMAKAQSSGSQTPVKNTWNPISKIKDFLVGGLTNMLFQPVLKLLNVVAYGIFYLFGLLLSLAGALLDFVLTKPELNKFTTSPIVGFGWEQCRNLANMFFALILLVISFATILRIESYGIKQVLPRLIIAALLINFSLVIAGVIIDFTQVLTTYFVQQALAGTNGSSLSGTIANKLNVTEGILRTNQAAGTPPISDSIDGIIASIAGIFAGIIVILIATFTFFAAAIFFVIRYIALLFLLILAPLAWFFYIVPATRTYWNQWWNTFFKWAFFAPAYTFFLWISMQIIKGNVMNQVGPNGANVVAGTSSAFGRYSIPTLINFTIMIGFLLGSLIVAQKLGIYGAGAVIRMGKSAGRGFGRMTGRWAARGAPLPAVVAPVLRGASKLPLLSRLNLAQTAEKYEQRKAAAAKKIKETPYVGAAVGAAAAIRKTLPTLFVPAVWKRALATSRARAESQSYSKAAGRLEGLLSGSAQQAKMREQQAHNTEVAKKEDEFKKNYRDEDARVSAYQKLKDPVEKEAMLRILAATSAINTLFTKPEMAQHLSTDEKTGEKKFDGVAAKRYIEKTFGDDAGRVAADISAIGAEAGNASLVGMAKWDDKKQAPRIATDTEQETAASIKMKEMEPQDWNRRTHPDSFFEWQVKTKLDDQGKAVLDAGGKEVKMLMRTSELSGIGKALVRNINGNHIKQIDRMQGRTLEAIHDATPNIQEYAKTLPAENQAIIQEWLDKIAAKFKPSGAEQTGAQGPKIG
jgi:hypothetical protein